MSFFEKKISNLVLEDIEWLIKNEITESEKLEFKSNPNKENAEPFWNGKRLSNHGKEKILKEVVSFVNSIGGRLILGLDEIENEEGKVIPTAITPIQNAAKLVSSLNNVLHQSIEPTITFEEPIIIDLPEENSSIVVYEFMQSPFSPHRSSKDNRFYTRRLDKSESMTVNEIRNNLLKSLDNEKRIEENFSKAKLTFIEDFGEKYHYFYAHPHYENYKTLGCNLTLVPIHEMYYPKLFNELNNGDIKGKWISKFGDDERVFSSSLYKDKKPILRGVRFTIPNENLYSSIIDLFENGTISISRFQTSDFSTSGVGFYEIMKSFAEAFSLIKKLNKIDTVDYAIQVMFYSKDSLILSLLNQSYRLSSDFIPKSELILPNYLFLSSNDNSDLFKAINQDIYNICGKYFSHPDFTAYLKL